MMVYRQSRGAGRDSDDIQTNLFKDDWPVKLDVILSPWRSNTSIVNVLKEDGTGFGIAVETHLPSESVHG